MRFSYLYFTEIRIRLARECHTLWFYLLATLHWMLKSPIKNSEVDNMAESSKVTKKAGE